MATTETTLLIELAIIMVLAAIVIISFTKLRIPIIIGYLFAGMMLSPNIMPTNLIPDLEVIDFLANMGIILLMFSIGLDFNIRRLRRIGSFAILAGTIEIAIMFTIGYYVGMNLGWDNVQALFFGAVLSISSTAVIIRVLTETGRLGKEEGDAVIGLLIVEDIAAVVILTFLAPIGAGDTPALGSVTSQLVFIAIFLVVTLILGLALVPRIINWVGRNYNDEVILIVSLGFCFGMAIFAFEIGLSVAIGAFLLGVMISESQEGERIAGRVLPLKEVFMAVFFVSIGLMINPQLILDNLWLMLLIVVLFIFGKILAVSIGTFSANKSAKTALSTGLAMTAMGEFSFVIAKAGVDTGVVTETFYSVVIASALVTMIIMPVIFKRADRLEHWIGIHMPRSIQSSFRRVEGIRTELGECLSVRADRRRQITFQIFWIIIDFVILWLIQLLVQSIFNLSEALAPIAQWLEVVPATLASIVSVVLIIPPVVDVIRRIRNIGLTMVKSMIDTGHYQWDSGRFLLKQLVNLLTVMAGIIIFFAVLPIAPLYDEFPIIPLVGVVIGLLVAYLLWDANKSTYEKMCAFIYDDTSTKEKE